MPRVHFVKKARKDNPAVGAGESYYWWKFRFGPKRCSKKRPKRSQLTQSDFLATLWDLEDDIGEKMTESDADQFRDELECLRDECQDRLDCMPEQLQDTSDSGMLLQERIDGLEEWVSEIENIDWESIDEDEAAELIQDTNPGLG